MLLALSDTQLMLSIGTELEELGWEAEAANTGRAALDFVSQNPVTAVVAPMLLNDMMGTQLLSELRGMRETLILILLATASNRTQLQADSKANAVVDPRDGVGAIVRALDRFTESTKAKPSRPKAVPRPRTHAAPLPDLKTLRGGSFRQVDPARVVGSVVRLTQTGILLMESREAKRAISVERGVPVFAQSTEVGERFGEFLVRSNVIARADLERALPVAARNERMIGAELVSIGALRQEDLDVWVQAHVRDQLVACFAMRDGLYQFREQRIEPPTRPEQLPQPLELLRLGVHNRYDDMAELSRLLPAQTVLRPAMPLEGIAKLSSLGQSGLPLLEGIDGKTPIGDVIAQSPHKMAAHQLFYALYAGGALFEVPTAD